MRNNFNLHLSRLHDELVKMGELLEKAISDAANALITNDTNLAKNAIEMEETIDKKEKEIEAECLKLLLLEQPIARDLRFVSAALKMITDMERIGDQAEDVARLVKYILPIMPDYGKNILLKVRISIIRAFFCVKL